MPDPDRDLVSEPSAMSDQELIDAYRAGDVASFEELYRRHAPMVLRRLTRLCGNGAIAEELSQEAFLRAAQKICSLTRDVRFRAWVLRIGTNLGIDHLRALKRQPAQSLDAMQTVSVDVSRGVVDTEQSVERREDARFVNQILGRLNPRHRRVLVLREIEGLDYRAIADRLAISSSAVETLLFRARGRFREEYTRALAG